MFSVGVCNLYCHLLSITYTKIGTIQRRLAWLLPKEDTQNHEAFHISLSFFFVRLCLRVPPKESLQSETGLLIMRRIWKRKCMLIHHIKNMWKEILAKQVYLEQIEDGWPGLSKEVTIICEELGIEDVNSAKIEKNALRKVLEKAFHSKDEKS